MKFRSNRVQVLRSPNASRPTPYPIFTPCFSTYATSLTPYALRFRRLLRRSLRGRKRTRTNEERERILSARLHLHFSALGSERRADVMQILIRPHWKTRKITELFRNKASNCLHAFHAFQPFHPPPAGASLNRAPDHFAEREKKNSWAGSRFDNYYYPSLN